MRGDFHVRFCERFVVRFHLPTRLNQKKTQIKYLTQQIAALQAYKSSLEQGYGIMKSEWGAIGNFKNGEFGLHQGYYKSLSAVNPEIKSSVSLSNIQAEQQSIVNQFNVVQNF